MHRILLLITSLFSLHAPAQLLERNAQASHFSRTDRVVRWNDSLWAFAGNITYLNSPISAVLTTVIDTTGQLKWEIPTFAPNGEVLAAEAIAPLNDSVVITGGWTMAACDIGPTSGFLMARGVAGDSLWSRTHALWPLEHLATPGSAILASSGDQVLVMDQQGDSIDQVTLNWEIDRLRTVDSIALASCDSGILVLDGDASVLLSHSFSSGASDFIRHTDSTYACLSGGWLYVLDSALAPLDSVDYGPVGGGASVHADFAYLWVIGSDTARFFDTALDPIIAFPMASPPGHALSDAAVGSDVIMTAGSFTSQGITTAVQRSVGKHGELFDAPVDAGLGGVTAQDIVITPASPDHYDVDLALRVWVRNDGLPDLNNVFLTVPTGSWTCGPVGVINQTGLGLLPGDSVLAYLGGISVNVTSPDSMPVDITLCVIASAPDERMDRDTTDDRSCGMITIPVGLQERPPLNALWVHPDPAQDELHVAPSVLTGRPAYRILDARGRIVRRGTLRGTVIDLSGLADGVHTLLIDGQRGVARFMILR